MTTETLRKLISHEFERGHTFDAIKKEVMRLLDLFESENAPRIYSPVYAPSTEQVEPEYVMYAEICGCNPKNGGSGLCGCTLGGTMVKNPKRFGFPTMTIHTSGTTDSEIEAKKQ